MSIAPDPKMIEAIDRAARNYQAKGLTPDQIREFYRSTFATVRVSIPGDPLWYQRVQEQTFARLDELFPPRAEKVADTVRALAECCGVPGGYPLKGYPLPLRETLPTTPSRGIADGNTPDSPAKGYTQSEYPFPI